MVLLMGMCNALFELLYTTIKYIDHLYYRLHAIISVLMSQAHPPHSSIWGIVPPREIKIAFRRR